MPQGQGGCWLQRRRNAERRRKSTFIYAKTLPPTPESRIKPPTISRSSSSSLQRCHVWTPHISADFLPCYPNFHIRDSCNGLLFCFSNQESKMYVCKMQEDALEGSFWPLITNSPLIITSKFLGTSDYQNHHPNQQTQRSKIFSSKTRRWGKVELATKGSRLPNWNARLCARYASYLNGSVYATISPQHLIAIPGLFVDEDPKQYQ